VSVGVHVNRPRPATLESLDRPGCSPEFSNSVPPV